MRRTVMWGKRLKCWKTMPALRLRAARLFGLVFLLPGFVGPNLPAAWASAAAYGDLATALLAILALLAVRVRFLFWSFVWAFNLVGLADLVMDTARAASMGLPSMAGQLGAAYAIPILYVPALFWIHLVALWMLVRPARAVGRAANGAMVLATE